MCTVVFIPKGNSCYFASLRDEDPERLTAAVPEIQTINNVSILSPVDRSAGGTWVGVNDMGYAAVLLNGAFKDHIRQQKHSKSRGLIAKEILASTQPFALWQRMTMTGIEPFTLILWYSHQLYQLTWDGKQKQAVKLLNDQCYIWSSATLYSDHAQQYRSMLFKKWTSANRLVSFTAVLDFFRSYTEAENGFIMNRNERIKTLSYSFIEIVKQSYSVMHYCNLLSTDTVVKELAFKNTVLQQVTEKSIEL